MIGDDYENMGTILMKYNPIDEYNTLGYHKTSVIYKESILKNGFTPSTDVDDWLGEGVYFWEDFKDAEWWKQERYKNMIKACIFVCNISCMSEKYLNLNNDINKVESFCKQYIKELKKTWKHQT